MAFSTDVRHALRGLLRAPTVAAAGILCLGLGLGATTAIYSAVHAALLRPLPFPEPDGLVTVYRTTPHFNTGPFSPANYVDLRAGTRTLEHYVAVQLAAVLLEGSEQAERVSAARVADNFFAALRVAAVRGRLLHAGDSDAEQPLVVVLSDELWRERYGADPGIIGTVIRIDAEAHEVVGVAPPRLRVPHGSGVMRADLWLPLRFTPSQATVRRNNFLRTFGRLRAGTSVQAADAELRSVMDGIIEANPVLRGEHLRVLPLRAESVSTVRGPLTMLFGAVAFVLLIAAANVASLLLARGVGRAREVAVRSVLGANRWAVVRPALLESLLLTAAGFAVGLGLAWAGVRVIGVIAVEYLPQLHGLTLDAGVLGVASAIALVVAVVCGTAPAWQAGRGDPNDALRAGARSTAGREQRFLRAVVAIEVGLALVLLLGAGLVLRGFQHLVGGDPGFEAEHLLTANVILPADRHPDGTVAGFLMPALDAVRAVPGVIEAGAITLLPYDNWGWNFNIRYEGQSGDDPTRLPLVETRTVTPETFAVFGHRLVAGRLLERADQAADAPTVVVVNQVLADGHFPGENAVGRRFHASDTTFATIIGVVSSIRNCGPDRPLCAEVYWPWRENSASTEFPIVVRTAGDPADLAAALRQALFAIDDRIAITGVRPQTDIMAESVGRPRFYLTLLLVFAGIAMVLALAGLYGVTSYVVAGRTREIGIRTALGSTPRDTIELLMRQGMALVSLGAIAGLVAAAGLTRVLSTLLYGISPLDSLTWSMVTLALAVTAATAIFVPAARAARVEPLTAIRND
ncbi:MAG: ABC transporter permease [Gemmatimonadetes bacterium]|nr:ABC transporter permease [Gemmatimonadota bacterium]